MSIFSASLSDAELAHSTDTFGCELGRRLEEAKADLAASRALVAGLKPYVQHVPQPTGACRENYCCCGAAVTLALTEADMRERLEGKA